MWMIRAPFNAFLDILFPPSCFVCKKVGISFCNICLTSTKKAIDTPYPFIYSLFSFKDQHIRKAIHAAKFFHRRDLLVRFGSLLGETLIGSELRGTIVPIPMHPLRKMIRGYNQAEVLAERAAKDASLPYNPHLLRKRKLTKRQALTQTKGERLKSQRNSLIVSGKVSGIYILIDDVTTTGATLLEARNILLKHGASEVYALTIAH